MKVYFWETKNFAAICEPISEKRKGISDKQNGRPGTADCLSIAAASLIAKVERDRTTLALDKLYPDYQFARHKG